LRLPNIPAEVGQWAAVRTVEVEPVLETPSHWPRHAAVLLPLLAKGRREFQQASQRYTLRKRLIGFEPATVAGAKTATDKKFDLYPDQKTAVSEPKTTPVKYSPPNHALDR